MFKRKVAVIMAILTLTSVTSAYAAPQSMVGMSPQVAENYRNAPEEVQELIEHDDNLQEAAQLAYMDLDESPADLREEIIAAREKIIFNELSWSADGGYIKKADGTIEVMPVFSDLFPGWDLPGASDLNSADSISLYGIEDLETTRIKNYSIPRYRESVQAPVMTNLLSHSVETFAVVVASLNVKSCNVSIGRGTSVTNWKNGLTTGQEIHIFPVEGQRYNVRVSSHYANAVGSFDIIH